MSTLVSTILALAARQLQDATNIAWDATNVLLPYYNLGVLEVCNLKPEAYPVTKTVVLVAGATQSLDDTAIELLDVVCNMGVDGATPGKNIRILSKEAVDLLLPDWQTYPPGSVVLFIMIDSRNPKYFYTIPPIAVATSLPQIKLIQAADESVLDDSYTPALVDYVVYRALAESTTIAGAMQKAGLYLSKFMQDLGLKTAIEKTVERKEKGEPDVATQ
jgi:hypothetical protein